MWWKRLLLALVIAMGPALPTLTPTPIAAATLKSSKSSKPKSSKSTSGKKKTVHVRAYTKKDGTQVRSHMRSPPTRK